MAEQLKDSDSEVFRISLRDAAAVTDVLVESFRDYPVMRFVLGTAPDYDARLLRLIGMFVAARVMLDDVILGIKRDGELVAVATTSDPAIPSHPGLAAMRDEVWAELGPTAKARYDLCVNAWGAMASELPQLHVNMLGVRRAYQLQGFAGKLLRAVHEMADRSESWQGVSLTTEDPHNVPFYEHLGYRVIGRQMVAPELEAWSLFRVIA